VLDVGCLGRRGDGWWREAWGEQTRAQRPIVVAVSCDRSWEQIAGVVGVLRACCVYVPIEPRTPDRRAAHLIELSEAQAVVTAPAAASREAWLGGGVLSVPSVVVSDGWRAGDGDESAEAASAAACALQARAVAMAGGCVHPRDLAYLIYTSGSTGVPKGVACHHEGAMNTIDDVNERHGVGEEDACLALSSLSFDLSVYDVFGLLSAGGRVVLPSSESTAVPSPSYWLSLVSSEGVSVWNSVPAFVELLVGDAEHHGSSLPRCLRLVLMSGGWISPGLPSRLGALRASGVAGGVLLLSERVLLRV
jgi:non-ribosomal peptide synthetase component F